MRLRLLTIVCCSHRHISCIKSSISFPHTLKKIFGQLGKNTDNICINNCPFSDLVNFSGKNMYLKLICFYEIRNECEAIKANVSKRHPVLLYVQWPVFGPIQKKLQNNTKRNKNEEKNSIPCFVLWLWWIVNSWMSRFYIWVWIRFRR